MQHQVADEKVSNDDAQSRVYVENKDATGSLGYWEGAWPYNFFVNFGPTDNSLNRLAVSLWVDYTCGRASDADSGSDGLPARFSCLDYRENADYRLRCTSPTEQAEFLSAPTSDPTYLLIQSDWAKFSAAPEWLGAVASFKTGELNCSNSKRACIWSGLAMT